MNTDSRRLLERVDEVFAAMDRGANRSSRICARERLA